MRFDRIVIRLGDEQGSVRCVCWEEQEELVLLLLLNVDPVQGGIEEDLRSVPLESFAFSVVGVDVVEVAVLPMVRDRGDVRGGEP